jgi:hypothetical protein
MKKTKLKINHSEKQPPSLSQKPNQYLFLIPLLIGLAGFILVFISSSGNGIGISGDSVQYITWARNFLQYHSFTTPKGDYLTLWPPLYPLLISLSKMVGINEFLSTRLISSISFGLIIFVTGLWCLKYSRSLLLSIIGSLLVFSKAIIQACCWAWSDPLFVLFTLAFLLLIPEILNNPTYKLVLMLALVTSAATLTRYTGVVLFPVGAFALFFGIKQFRKKIIFTFIWGLVSVIPIGLWMLRTYRLTGSITGLRFTHHRPVFPFLNEIGVFFSSWFIAKNTQSIPGWIFLALFSIIISAIFILYIYKLIESKNTNWPVLAICLFIIAHILLLIYSAYNSCFGGPIEERFLSPLYPLMIMLFMFSAIKLYAFTAKYVRFAVVILYVLGISIWSYAAFNQTYSITKFLYHQGFGLANATWKNSQTIAWLKYNKLNGKIYTNDSPALYILADMDSCLSPAKLDCNPNPESIRLKQEEMEKFKSGLATDKNTYLIWFARHIRTYLYDPEQLQQFCNMRLAAQLNDGYIIALYPKDSSALNK